MRQPEGQDVGRVLAEDSVPDREAAIHIAGDPTIERLELRLFPRGRCRHCGARFSRRFGGVWDLGELIGEHREIARDTMRETEFRIGRESVGEMLCGVGAVFQVSEDGASLVAGRRLRRGCRDRKPMQVRKHGVLLFRGCSQAPCAPSLPRSRE